MRSILILAIFVLVFASCHSDVPGLPSSDKIKFCKYEDKNGKSQCESTYVISEADCKKLKENGKAELFSDKDCKVPYKEDEE
ncbi:MAG: hypothetical protein LBC87_09055 [Fibromonadaceae bacterium]|jgi:hypothetical protein|nr:hypothetical protein [Fibromonadaceae bacterium]